MAGTVLDYFSLSALVNATTSGFLGFFVLFYSSREYLARFLSFFCFSVFFWSVGYFFWQISDTSHAAILWSRILMAGAIFTSVSFFHLTLVFLKKDKLPTYRRILFIFYGLTMLWLLANFTSYFVSGVAEKMSFKFWPTPGPLYIPFLFTFAIEVLAGSYLLFKKFIDATNNEKKQALLLLIGILAAFLGGSTNYFLWFDIQIAPWGNILVSAYVFLLVYAMMKYKLLNLKFLSLQIISVFLLLVLLIDVFVVENNVALFFRIFIATAAFFLGLTLIYTTYREVQQQQQLEETNHKLQALNREKSEFLSIAVHQLRTPLTIVGGYLELLKDGAFGVPSTKMKKIYVELEDNNQRMVNAVDDFLNLARIEDGQIHYYFKKQDIGILINEVINTLSVKAQEKSLKIKWKPISFDCSFDKEIIRHVLINLVSNAIKYSDKGVVEVKLEFNQDKLSVRIFDQGIGFCKEDEEKLFQQFYRGENSKEQKKGTGLGLYIVRRFVEAHGGEVWAKSEGLGKGSEFGFYLPRV